MSRRHRRSGFGSPGPLPDAASSTAPESSGDDTEESVDVVLDDDGDAAIDVAPAEAPSPVPYPSDDAISFATPGITFDHPHR